MTHYKVLAKDKGLSHILAWAITLPFQHGFSPTRWRTAIQFMLEKEPGNLLITKLRVIQLLEADMNFAFCLLCGKRLVHHALAQNALSPLNFGGRPGCRVHSALLLKTLSFDYIRYTRLNAIIFNNNAKACFDRIIPSIGLMATEQLGMPSTASACMLATIQGMKFFIRTAHGVSPGYFTSTLSALTLGVLQGSGAVPCIWLSINCVLLHALSSHTTGFQATCPCYSKTSKCPGEAFLDDADLWLTSTSSSASGTLITSMQKVAQLWESLHCRWWGPGHPKMLLLLGSLVLGPQRLPSAQFQHHPLRSPTRNDLRQVNIHPYYSMSQKQHWEAHTGSVFISRWIV